MQSNKTFTSLVDRFAGIPGLFMTSLVCYTFLTLQLSGYRGSEETYGWTQRNKAIVTIIVQVISHILGLIHVQVLCSLLRASFVLSLRSKTFPVYHVQFIQAASTPRMTWGLPCRFLILLLFIVVGSFVPAALWAGALAPLPSERNLTQTLHIPTFEISDLSKHWNDGSTNRIPGSVEAWIDPKAGLLSDNPSVNKGLLTVSAGDASVVGSDGKHKHAKLDKSGFSYIERSYGTGSIAGVVQIENATYPNWFTYVEDGLSTEVSCFYNRSTRFSVQRASVEGSQPSFYWATGFLADGQPVSSQGPFYQGYEDHDIFIWAPSYSDESKTVTVQLATLASPQNDPWGFHLFNQTQCDIKFRRQKFSVSVNTTGRTVTSTPLDDNRLVWPSYGDKVLDSISWWLGSLSFLDTGCAGGCQLGKTMTINVQQLNATNNVSNDKVVLAGAENYMASLVDNILENLLLLRMVAKVPDATREVAATVGVPSVVYGELKFTVAIAVINLAITVAYVIQLIRTRAWSGIPALDISNICEVIVGAWRGGIDFGRSSNAVIADDHWNRQPLADSTEMCLKYDDHSLSDTPMLVPLVSIGQPAIALRVVLPATRSNVSLVSRSGDSLDDKVSLLKGRPLSDFASDVPIGEPMGRNQV